MVLQPIMVQDDGRTTTCQNMSEPALCWMATTSALVGHSPPVNTSCPSASTWLQLERAPASAGAAALASQHMRPVDPGDAPAAPSVWDSADPSSGAGAEAAGRRSSMPGAVSPLS